MGAEFPMNVSSSGSLLPWASIKISALSSGLQERNIHGSVIGARYATSSIAVVLSFFQNKDRKNLPSFDYMFCSFLQACRHEARRLPNLFLLFNSVTAVRCPGSCPYPVTAGTALLPSLQVLRAPVGKGSLSSQLCPPCHERPANARLRA